MSVPFLLTPGASGVRASGTWLRSPWAGTWYEAELACVPMTRPQEYAQGLLFEQPCETPVLVSLSQRHRLLADLVRSLRAGVPGLGCVVVRLYGPDFDIPLPAGLLADYVLLVHEPMEMLGALLATGRRNVALIQQDLRADGTERGGNTLSVTLLQPDPAGPAAADFEAWVRQQPLLQTLDGLRIEPFGQPS